MSMSEAEIALIREKARNKRYKKPLHKQMNLESITNELYDIQSACDDVRWFFEGGDESLLDELIGGEDEVSEFKFMFSGLAYDAERLYEDMQEEYIPEFFDMFFVAIANQNQELVGFDEFEGDYFGLNLTWETEYAIKEAQTKMKRVTKDQIIEGACRCFQIAMAYTGIKSRFEDLSASMDIIRGQNKAELEVLKTVNEMYERANEISRGFRFKYEKSVMELDNLISGIDPYSRLWLE